MSVSIRLQDETSVRRAKLALLDQTREYLRDRLAGEVPDPLLVAAWEDFYRCYNKLIRRFVVAHGLLAGDVDDCVQEVWTAVVVRLTDFRSIARRPGLNAWLYKIARSKACDLMRRRSRHRCDSLLDEGQVSRRLGQSDDDPAALFEKQWETATCRTLLDGLQSQVSPLNARLMQLRFKEGRSVREVAKALGLTAEQVRYRQHRLLRKMRSRMARYAGNASARQVNNNLREPSQPE